MVPEDVKSKPNTDDRDNFRENQEIKAEAKEVNHRIGILLITLSLICFIGAVQATGAWAEAYVSPASTIRSIGVFLGNPYAGSTPGGVIYYKYGTNDWTTSYATGETTVYALYGWGTQCYAGTGETGKIFRGSGTSWSLVNDTASSSIRCFATYSGSLYAGGANVSQGVLYSTTDGTAWNLVNGSIEGTVWDIEEFKGNLVIATGSDGEIWKYDLSTWTLAEDLPGTQVYSLEFFNGYLYAATGGAGGYGRIYRTSDGDTWTEVFNSGTSYVYTLETFNNRIYAGGYNGMIYTSSTGETWETDYSTAKLYVYSLADDSGDVLFAGTGITSGTVYKLDASSITSGAGIQYPPHSVDLRILTFFGSPISGATVTATPIGTSMGGWSWIADLFGISSDVDIAGDTMTETTDSDGHAGFIMLESVTYQINVTHPDIDDYSQTLNPTGADYTIYVTDWNWFEGGEDIQSVVNVTSYTSAINATHQGITVIGNDTGGGITGGTILLNVTDGFNETTVQTYTVTGNFSHTFPVTDYTGNSYKIQVNLTQSDVGYYHRSFAITFDMEDINPLGLSGDLLLKGSLGILLLCGCIFTATTSHNGPLLTCFVGWILLSFGWLDSAGKTSMIAALTIATVLSIIIVLAARKEAR